MIDEDAGSVPVLNDYCLDSLFAYLSMKCLWTIRLVQTSWKGRVEHYLKTMVRSQRTFILKIQSLERHRLVEVGRFAEEDCMSIDNLDLFAESDLVLAVSGLRVEDPTVDMRQEFSATFDRLVSNFRKDQIRSVSLPIYSPLLKRKRNEQQLHLMFPSLVELKLLNDNAGPRRSIPWTEITSTLKQCSVLESLTMQSKDMSKLFKRGFTVPPTSLKALHLQKRINVMPKLEKLHERVARFVPNIETLEMTIGQLFDFRQLQGFSNLKFLRLHVEPNKPGVNPFPELQTSVVLSSVQDLVLSFAPGDYLPEFHYWLMTIFPNTKAFKLISLRSERYHFDPPRTDAQRSHHLAEFKALVEVGQRSKMAHLEHLIISVRSMAFLTGRLDVQKEIFQFIMDAACAGSFRLKSLLLEPACLGFGLHPTAFQQLLKMPNFKLMHKLKFSLTADENVLETLTQLVNGLQSVSKNKSITLELYIPPQSVSAAANVAAANGDMLETEQLSTAMAGLKLRSGDGEEPEVIDLAALRALLASKPDVRVLPMASANQLRPAKAKFAQEFFITGSQSVGEQKGAAFGGASERFIIHVAALRN